VKHKPRNAFIGEGLFCGVDRRLSQSSDVFCELAYCDRMYRGQQRGEDRYGNRGCAGQVRQKLYPTRRSVTGSLLFSLGRKLYLLPFDGRHLWSLGLLAGKLTGPFRQTTPQGLGHEDGCVLLCIPTPTLSDQLPQDLFITRRQPLFRVLSGSAGLKKQQGRHTNLDIRPAISLELVPYIFVELTQIDVCDDVFFQEMYIR